MSETYCYPTRSCLKADFPIAFHGVYEQYDSEVPHLDPQSAPEIDFAITANKDSELMATGIASYVECGFVGGSPELCQEVASVFRQIGGVADHWKLWQVIITRQDLILSFVHRETGITNQLQLDLSTMGSVRMTFRIFSGQGESRHKLYLDYQYTHYRVAILKVAEWRREMFDIAMMTRYMNVGTLTLSRLFQNDFTPVQALLESNQTADS